MQYPAALVPLQDLQKNPDDRNADCKAEIANLAKIIRHVAENMPELLRAEYVRVAATKPR